MEGCSELGLRGASHATSTREFDQQVRNVLNDDGFYLVNVIDKLNGGLFIPSFVRTLKAVFPHVYVMSAGTPWLSQMSFPNTFIVVGTATPLDLDRLKQVEGFEETLRTAELQQQRRAEVRRLPPNPSDEDESGGG